MLIHARLEVRDKVPWALVLAIVGFEVMMFNWIAVHCVMTGSHSYGQDPATGPPTPERTRCPGLRTGRSCSRLGNNAADRMP